MDTHLPSTVNRESLRLTTVGVWAGPVRGRTRLEGEIFLLFSGVQHLPGLEQASTVPGLVKVSAVPSLGVHLPAGLLPPWRGTGRGAASNHPEA